MKNYFLSHGALALIAGLLCILCTPYGFAASGDTSHADIKPRTRFVPKVTPLPAKFPAPAPAPASVDATEPVKQTGKRLEDDINAIEKVRFILKEGIPSRMTVQIPNDEGGTSAKTEKLFKKNGAKKIENAEKSGAKLPTCDLGAKQLPMEIISADSVSLDLEHMRFDYGAMIGTVINTGHAVQIKPDGHHFLGFRGRTYQLSQLRFNYPSKERIDGKEFAMSAHLVHEDAKGQKLVLTVLFDLGASNPIVSAIWGRMPFDAHGQNPVEASGLPITALFPEQRGYFMYGGTQTTPLCDKGVLRVVLKTPVTISAEQIMVVQKLFQAATSQAEAVNGRLVMQSR